MNRSNVGGACLAALALALTACGGGPGRVTDVQTPELPTEGRGPPRLEPVVALRLGAPKGLDRFEPSGAAVVDGVLWVVNDRDAWLVGYALTDLPPAGTGVSAADGPPPRLTPKHARLLTEKKSKFEGLSPEASGGMLAVETFGSQVFRLGLPLIGPVAPAPELLNVDEARDALQADVALGYHWITWEAVARAPDGRVLVGRRSYNAAGQGPNAFTPAPRVAAADGALAAIGPSEGWKVGDRVFSLSDMAAVEDGYWMTLSFEDDTRHGAASVAGLLAFAPRDPQTGLPGPVRLCGALPGKPEGVAVWGRQLFVVFDHDADRKRGGDNAAFELDRDEDLLWVLPARCGAPDAEPSDVFSIE